MQILKSLFLYLIGSFVLMSLMSPSCQDFESPPAEKKLKFEKKILHSEFISEGVAIADVNQDGQKDILAGPYWFEGPDWGKHEFRPVKSFDHTKEWSDSFLCFATDVNQDGWTDLIRVGFPGQAASWYENPQNKPGHWEEHFIDSTVCNESPMLADPDGNGQMDLVFGHENSGQMMWFQPPEKGADLIWTANSISEPESPGTKRFSHGLGFGDINGDGRKDIIIRKGWWEAPADVKQLPWNFHPSDLGEPCSQMYSYDFDADGDQDVISASAHAYGIWWHEQKNQAGKIEFTRHLIDSSFSQTHGVAFADMNQDGLPDLVTGKRYFAHNGKDPGGLEAAVLYWLELQRDEHNNPQWIKHQIDNDSGVGLHVIVEDINMDGKLDILNSNKKGVIIFFQM